MTQVNKPLDGGDTGQMRRSDKWIPWYFVAFFVVLAIMDGVFVYIANETHTGVVTDNAYNEGLRYNETIAAAEASESLGWNVSFNYTEGVIAVVMLDKESLPVSGANVKAVFVRPTQDGRDFSVSLQEMAGGRYAAPVEANQGQWEIRIFASWQQKQFQTVKRIVVQPN